LIARHAFALAASCEATLENGPEGATPKKVLHVLGCMQPGGAEVRLLELMSRLCPREFRVDVCALSGLAGSLEPHVRALGGSVVPLPLDARFAWRFPRLLRRGRYDVVHSHVLLTSGPILALAAAAGVPVRVAHFHSMHDGHAATLRRRTQRASSGLLVERYATNIIACGEGSMDAVWHSGWRDDPRCQVVYDALDPARFEQRVDGAHVRADLGIPTEAQVFLHVGNEVAAKNHRRLLAIFSALRAIAPSSWLVLAGAKTDDPHGVTAKGIRELGIGDRVAALGVRDDVPRLLKAADALLLPSLREGLPGAVLEACASGVPVLATDLPGVREIASRLPLVRYLPLSASDEEWAEAAAELSAEAARLKLRETAAEAFRASVFHIDRAVEAHRRLWSGIRERSALSCS
jgi:glycosyltransferase involved in cell wall biosynthesis